MVLFTCHVCVFLIEVHDMCEKYGYGKRDSRKCGSCNYEQVLRSTGVHISEGGSISVYADEDEFSCPNWDNMQDQDSIDMSTLLPTSGEFKGNLLTFLLNNCNMPQFMVFMSIYLFFLKKIAAKPI